MNETNENPKEPEFSVTPLVLKFRRNEPKSQRIDIKSDEFKYGLMIRVTHNLSDHCFTDIPINFLTSNSSIHVIPKDNVMKMMPEKLFIKFRNHLDETDENAITVEVKYVEEKDDQEKAPECEICLLEYTSEGKRDPIILSACGHTICNSCFQQLAERNTVYCPFDRTKSKGPFPKNFALCEMLQYNKRMGRKRNLEETEECIEPIIPCCENEHHESTCYCTNCEQDYCMNCYTMTHSFKTRSNHKMVRISEKPLVKPKCLYHPNVNGELICKTEECDMFGETYCWKCAYFRHKHEGQCIEEYMKNNKKTLEKILEDLAPTLRKFWNKFNFLFDCLEKLEKAAEFHSANCIKTEGGRLKMNDFLRAEKKKIFGPQRENDVAILKMREMEKRIKLILFTKKLYDVEQVVKHGQKMINLDPGNYGRWMRIFLI
uniref:RING-type domain-containing protein n=1 Tax=Caenorhabditis tropicalis TaxID=1561998 RepID=A0A1I7UFI1_9PELO